jgi:tetratricopeptide (TPR) repeat protein
MRYYFGSFFIENFLDSVLVLADIAISYDDQLDGAYLTKASYYWFKGRGEDALANCDKAKEYIQEALSLDGDSANYFLWLSYIEFYSGNLENAALLSEKANQPVGEYFSFAGHDREAYKIAENVVENLKKTGGIPFKYAHRIGYAHWKMGKTKEAEYWFNEQIRIGTESIKQGSIDAIWKTAQYDLAAVYAFLGDKEKAYQYLDEVNSGRFALQLIPYIKYDCLFNSIRNEERFQKILSDMESKYQAEHERVRKWM